MAPWTAPISRIRKAGHIYRDCSLRVDRPGQSVNDFYGKLKTMREAWGSADTAFKNNNRAEGLKTLRKYKDLLGLTNAEINIMAFSPSPGRPKKLKLYESTADKISAARKTSDTEEMTDIARKVLGRK